MRYGLTQDTMSGCSVWRGPIACRSTQVCAQGGGAPGPLKLATRHFGLKNFGGLFGGLVAALSLGTAFGPLAAGATFDRFDSYAPFLVLTMIFMAVSSLALASLHHPPFAAGDHA
jgi:MFS family permease